MVRWRRNKRMAISYLDNLPPEVASAIAMSRIVSAADAAAFCNYSLPHWRRLYRAKKVPEPIRLSARKLGWRIGTLIEFNARREASR
jgi:predicted DNA-binding transcriptional regulator AlpA